MHNYNRERRKGITCSKKCSRIYERIYHYITQKLKYDGLKVDSIMDELKNLVRNAGRSSLINKDEIENLIVKYG